jgi:RNA polymerase sigma factor (sigma-70 family)
VQRFTPVVTGLGVSVERCGVVEGDRGSITDAYRTHFAGLKRLAFLLTGSEALAEDLVHDVFVRTAHRLAELDDAGVYLRTSVVNACRRHHRRQAQQLRIARPAEPSEPPTADALAVRQALMAMSPKRRAALVLRYYADLPHDEIAATLGCRTATARSLVRRGLDDLRGALDEH